MHPFLFAMQGAPQKCLTRFSLARKHIAPAEQEEGAFLVGMQPLPRLQADLS